jgi:beta-glucuronidase
VVPAAILVREKAAHARVLYLGAANYLARVWLNGYKLGDHVGGFTPFNLEVTDQLVDGANNLVIEVDNTRRLEGVPSMHTDWWILRQADAEGEADRGTQNLY